MGRCHPPPSDIDVLLQRRVVEILDGWRVLLGAEAEAAPAESKSRGGMLTRRTGAQGATSATFRGGMRSSTLGEQIVEAAHATEQRLRSMRSAAARDVERLSAALSAEATPAANERPTDKQIGIEDSNLLLSFQPQTYAEQVRYLELVAQEFGNWKSRRRSRGDLGPTPTLPEATSTGA